MSQELSTQTEVVKMKINTGMTKAGIVLQELHDMESRLVYNSDGLESMSELCAIIKKGKKIIDEVHKAEKAPAKAVCDSCDEAKRIAYKEFDEILNRVLPRMEAINNEENRKKREAIESDNKRKEIRVAIAHFLENYSQQIANCNNFDGLRAVENRVNLEKANKSKYGDLYEEAKTAFIELTNGISRQKEVIKQKEALDQQLLDAKMNKDDESAIKIMEEQDHLAAVIEDNKVKIQEAAISMVVNQKSDEVDHIYNTLDAKRKYWKWEVVNIDETVKKMKSWTKIEPDEEKIDDFLKASKDTWSKERKDEIVMNGIRFYLDKKLV